MSAPPPPRPPELRKGVSGVDERVETVRRAFYTQGVCHAPEADDAFDEILAAVADAEQRADDAEKARDKAVELAEHAAALAELYGQAIVDIHQIDGLDIRVRLICARLDTEGFSAAAVVSAEPTEPGEQG